MFPPNLSLLINAGTKCPKNTFIITAVGSTVQTSTARYGGDTFITFASHCHTFIFIKKTAACAIFIHCTPSHIAINSLKLLESTQTVEHVPLCPLLFSIPVEKGVCHFL